MITEYIHMIKLDQMMLRYKKINTIILKLIHIKVLDQVFSQ